MADIFQNLLDNYTFPAAKAGRARSRAYEQVARSRPPRDRPWYHVLPDDATHTTYVAERNLEPDESLEPIVHPLVPQFFEGFRDGRYVTSRLEN